MKYIDADKLIADIESIINSDPPIEYDLWEKRAYNSALSDVINLIDSPQQEQPGVQNRKFIFPKYLYARTKDNKTIDVSYAPQDMTAIKYVRNDFIEQQEVDLEKEYKDYVEREPVFRKLVNGVAGRQIARHFFELGLNAIKEE